MEATITIRIDEKEKEELARKAEELGVPFSQLVRQAIKDYIKQQEEKDKDGLSIRTF